MNTQRTAFIVNPAAASSRGEARWSGCQARFLEGLAGASVKFTAQAGDAVRLTREAAANNDIVVAAGGDGTVFEVASGLLLSGVTDCRFAIVPLGTGNDFARQCGIHDLAKARAALDGTRTMALDVVRVQCRAQDTVVTRFALLYAAVGIVGEVLKQTTPRVKRVLGARLAYPVGALRAILSYRAPRMRVTCDGQTREQPFLMVCASNSEEAGGGLRLAPDARMDDGVLNVNVCEPLGRLQTLALLWKMFRGRQLTHPKLRYFPARMVSVEAHPPIEVEADGELIGHTPAHFEVVPRVLQLLVG